MGLANLSTDLKEIQCGTCGVWHALPQVMYSACYEEGGFWYCPNGHQRGFNEGNLRNQNDALQKKLDRAIKAKEWAEQEAKNSEARRRAAQGQVTKIKKRVGNGVCPCCNRSFQNLHRHMKGQHPEFVSAASDTP